MRISSSLFTGVTKLGTSVSSDLNNLIDLSMDERYQTLCGITEGEIQQYFKESVRGLAQNNHLSYEAASARLEKDYDGYHRVEWRGRVITRSSVEYTQPSAFWSLLFETGTPSYLCRSDEQDNYPLPDLTQEQVLVVTSSIVLFDVDESHSFDLSEWLLTIKDYDERFGFYNLDLCKQGS